MSLSPGTRPGSFSGTFDKRLQIEVEVYTSQQNRAAVLQTKALPTNRESLREARETLCDVRANGRRRRLGNLVDVY